jgi:hypothetical protein
MSKPTDGGMKPPEREFVVHRITRVEIFEVTEQELESLEAAFGEESRSLAFFSSTVSVFAACFIGWITTGKSLPSVTHAILAGITLASFFLALWFALTWFQARRKRPSIINRIRERRGMQR